MSHPNFVLDKRVVHRNISKGILTQEDLDESIANLVDVADNAIVSRADAPEEEAEAEAAEGADAAATDAPADEAGAPAAGEATPE